jgi:hypothetical protein
MSTESPAIIQEGHRLEPKAAETVRGDSFVAETNIHYPTDSSLIGDGLRKVLCLAAMLAGRFGSDGWRTTDAGGSSVIHGIDGYDTVVFNTNLGGTPETQNAISPGFNLADSTWSVTGDFYVDVDASNSYTPGDTDLVVGQQYTIWFAANFNNWLFDDEYGTTPGPGYGNAPVTGKYDDWGSPGVQGTLIATATPKPASVLVWGVLGLAAAGFGRWRRKLAA